MGKRRLRKSTMPAPWNDNKASGAKDQHPADDRGYFRAVHFRRVDQERATHEEANQQFGERTCQELANPGTNREALAGATRAATPNTSR